MPMSNNDERAMTLRELAEAILALPAEQQGQRACYTMLDDEGFEVFEPVLEVRAEKNQVFLQDRTCTTDTGDTIMRDRAIARYADDSDLQGQVAQPDHSASYAEDAKIADREIRARKRLARHPGKAWKQAKRADAAK